jgi:hypothetical protein
MSAKRRQHALIASLMVGCALWLHACGPSANRPIPLPPNVLAARGEATAFETSAGADSTRAVQLDLGAILQKVRAVEDVDLLLWSGPNAFTRVQTERRDGRFFARLKPSQRYVLLGVLNQRARDTYAFLCRLHAHRVPGTPDRLPEICKRILCGNEAIPVDAILRDSPDLQRDPSLTAMKGTTIGDLGPGPVPTGPGDCEICTQTHLSSDEPLITPGVPCLSSPGGAAGGPTFVFARKLPNGSFQIFKSAGGTETNLSNNAFSDAFPDVAFTGSTKIAYASTGHGAGQDGIYTMNLDGSEQTLVQASPNPLSRTCWAGDRVVAYAEAGTRTSIKVIDVQHQLFPGVVQATSPGQQENDGFGHAFLPGHKVVVFSRLNSQVNDFDLFTQDFSEPTSLARLTTTPDISEEFPAVSHDETMLAFRELVFAPGTTTTPTAERIRIVAIPASGIPDLSHALHVVSLAPPAGMGITGLDFSADDKGLLVAVKSTDVTTAPTALDMQEIYFIKLDGTGQVRLTTNALQDSDPRAVPNTP